MKIHKKVYEVRYGSETFLLTVSKLEAVPRQKVLVRARKAKK